MPCGKHGPDVQMACQTIVMEATKPLKDQAASTDIHIFGECGPGGVHVDRYGYLRVPRHPKRGFC
jgi:hypothetical protein